MLLGRHLNSCFNSCRLILVLLLLGHSAFAGIAATGTLGVQAKSCFKAMDFGYNASLYYKFDDQVLLGAQSGQGVAGDASAIPILAAAYVRLPIGRALVPVATGGVGYVFSPSSSTLLWRAGGAFDIRNGRHSSILIGSEYEGRENGNGIVLRCGLLLEL